MSSRADTEATLLLPPVEQRREDFDKLPMGQIVLLCYARLVDPIAFFSIFPFINKMIHEEAGIPETDVGFYAGLIESLFSLTQILVMIGYGRAADRLGREPILVFSLCGISLASGLFGLSKSVLQIVKSPGVAAVLSLIGYTSVITYGYTAGACNHTCFTNFDLNDTVVSLFRFTSVDLGGLGFTPLQIALLIGLSGIAQAIWLIPFPYLHLRYGTAGVLRGCTYIWPIVMALNPLANLLLKHGWMTAFWIVVPASQLVGGSVSLLFTAIQLALNDIAPSPNSLGTLNAIFLTLNSALRAVVPGIFSSIFALGARTQLFGGQSTWALLVALTIGLWIAVRWYLPEQVERKTRTPENQ
ncbi:hypothetical protein FB45DRAFT_888824 [Roridomyces roridus]|uniref:Major facilitator superfamily (MFS) profile domain-containing protein n=1 Tax=Roridomyces roridus TaxID=1738132 RepID=A0AAD7CK74_9AGAR|nr:hypothetical protein FB45DRAFT_888824 [Roridomyces roridus]